MKSKPPRISRKVTAFVARRSEQGIELLLINHPNTDFQIPAGTAKKKEDPAKTAIREAKEETGLKDVQLVAALGTRETKYHERGRIVKKSKVYSRPAAIASTFGRIRRGLKVKLLDRDGDFVQIRYRERDNSKPDRPIMLNIKGWIKKSHFSQSEIRFFYLLTTADTRTQPWTIIADHHAFTLEWHNIDNLPPIAGLQQLWVEEFKAQIVENLEHSEHSEKSEKLENSEKPL